MYCFNCGNKLPDGALFCGKCGTKQEEAFSEEKPFQSASVPTYTEPLTDKKNNGGGKTVIAVCIVVAAALLAVAAYFVFGKEDKPQKDLIALEDMLKQEEETKEPEEPEEAQMSAPVETPAAQEVPEAQEEPESEISEEEEPEEEMPQYVLPNSDTVKLSREDLRSLSKEELRIARNEIYARHGRKFQDEELQRYFDSCDWYEGIYESENFPESLLSEIEIANRDLITEYEEFMGYR